MKKLTFKLSYDQVCRFDKWLEVVIEKQVEQKHMPYLESCATALIADWRTKKVHPHTHFFTGQKISLKLDGALAFAMMEFIQSYSLPITDQMGNWLNTLSREIDQHFQ